MYLPPTILELRLLPRLLVIFFLNFSARNSSQATSRRNRNRRRLSLRRCALRSASAERGPRNKERGGEVRDSGAPASLPEVQWPAGSIRREASPRRAS